MTVTNVELRGVIVPIITPVDNEDRVDEPAFRNAIRRLITAGVHGLFVGGSGGEGPLLTAHEWQRMLEIAQDETRDAIPLLAGAMDTSTQRIKERIRAIAALGYQYFVVTPTYYITLRAAGEHLRLFNACANAGAGLSMIAYNIPSCTHSVIPVEVLVDLAQRGLIQYCKESSADLDYFKRVVAAGSSVGLRVFMGDESCMAEGLRSGAVGIVPGSANIEPSTFIRAYAAAQRQDWDELMRMQSRITTLRANIPLAGSNWIAGIKYAAGLLGIGSGRVIEPLQPLDPEQQRQLAAFIKQGSEPAE